MPANELQRHSSGLQQACIGFIKAHFRLDNPNSHAVMGQTRVNRLTAAVEQVIVVHRHPKRSSPQLLSRSLPESYAGFPVVEQPWPDEDL